MKSEFLMLVDNVLKARQALTRAQDEYHEWLVAHPPTEEERERAKKFCQKYQDEKPKRNLLTNP